MADHVLTGYCFSSIIDNRGIPQNMTETKPMFKIEDTNDLLELMCVIQGIDPNQVQTMSKFMDVSNVDETTYYPNQITSIAIAQLRMFGEAFYRGESWNPYELCANLLGTGFKGFRGFKSEQYKDITSGQPNLDKLQGIPEETKKGILSGIFSRGSKE